MKRILYLLALLSILCGTSSPGSTAGICEAQWKLVYPTRKNGGDLELYDITADPGRGARPRNPGSRRGETTLGQGAVVCRHAAEGIH